MLDSILDANLLACLRNKSGIVVKNEDTFQSQNLTLQILKCTMFKMYASLFTNRYFLF